MNKISLQELTDIILSQAKVKGFGVSPDEISVYEKIALIHSETSEALDAYRHKNMDGKDGFAEELADVMIRVLHLAGVYKIDLEKEILKKIEYNENRKWDWENMNEKHQ
jgi:NTP pyrophosphatase (non-canonical NTP hydrolase)